MQNRYLMLGVVAVLLLHQQPTSLALDGIVTESEAVRAALADNRDLVAARLIVDQAKGHLTQAGLWPNPELETSFVGDQLFNNEGEYSVSAAFKQKFPITGRIRRSKELAEIDLRLAEAEILEQERQLSAEVLKVLRRSRLIDEKLKYNIEQQHLVGALVETTQARYELAEVSETDLNAEKLELEKLKVQEATLGIERNSAVARLLQLLGRPVTEKLILADESSSSITPEKIDMAERGALERRPDIRIANLRAERALRDKALARAERWEDWSVGLEFSRDREIFSEPIGNKRDDFFGVTLSVPLPLWNQSQGRIAEAEATTIRMKREKEALELQILAKIHAAKHRLNALAPLIKRYERESLELARKNVKTLQSSYSQGLVDVNSVLKAQEQLLELQQSYLNTKTDFSDALTEFQLETVSFEVIR